jgi:hypothetical protein
MPITSNTDKLYDTDLTDAAWAASQSRIGPSSQSQYIGTHSPIWLCLPAATPRKPTSAKDPQPVTVGLHQNEGRCAPMHMTSPQPLSMF